MGLVYLRSLGILLSGLTIQSLKLLGFVVSGMEGSMLRLGEGSVGLLGLTYIWVNLVGLN